MSPPPPSPALAAAAEKEYIPVDRCPLLLPLLLVLWLTLLPSLLPALTRGGDDVRPLPLAVAPTVPAAPLDEREVTFTSTPAVRASADAPGLL